MKISYKNKNLYLKAYLLKSKLDRKKNSRNIILLINEDLSLAQLKIFYRLIKFNKIVLIDNSRIFSKIFNLILVSLTHKKTLDDLYELEKNSHMKEVLQKLFT